MIFIHHNGKTIYLTKNKQTNKNSSINMFRDMKERKGEQLAVE